MGLPPELEKIVAHEDTKMGPHQEETEIVDLGTNNGKKELILSVNSKSAYIFAKEKNILERLKV